MYVGYFYGLMMNLQGTMKGKRRRGYRQLKRWEDNIIIIEWQGILSANTTRAAGDSARSNRIIVKSSMVPNQTGKKWGRLDLFYLMCLETMVPPILFRFSRNLSTCGLPSVLFCSGR